MEKSKGKQLLQNSCNDSMSQWVDNSVCMHGDGNLVNIHVNTMQLPRRYEINLSHLLKKTLVNHYKQSQV